MDPPQGPKSVGGLLSAPDWPRSETRSFQVDEPLELKPPGPPSPIESVCSEPPTYRRISLAAMERLSAVWSRPVLGWSKVAVQRLLPDGVMASSRSSRSR